jgi:hypothetical protein
MEIVDPRVDPALVPEGSRPVVIAKDQDAYLDLPAIVTPDRKVITRWQPTPEERQRILNGEDIFLTIWGTPIRPVCVTVGPCDWR